MSEMSDQVRAIIFVVLVVLVTFVWMHFYKPANPPAQHNGPSISQTAPGAGTAQPGNAVLEATPPAAVNTPVVQAVAEKIVTVRSALYDIQLSNRGGVVHSWTLSKYFDDQTPPRPLDLVNPDAARELGWPFSLQLSDTQLETDANAGLYEVKTENLRAAAPGEPLEVPGGANVFDAPVSVIFHWSNGHLDVTKKLNFSPDYQMSAEVSATLDGRPIPCGIAWRGGFGDRAVAQESQIVNVFYNQGGSLTTLQYKKLGVSGNQIQPFQQPGGMEFAGIEDQFFTAAFIPDGTDLYLSHWTQWHHWNPQSSEPVAEMAVGSATAGPVKLRAFVGPKELALLGKVQPSLEGLVQFGWMGVIAKPMLFILQWLHRYVPNYGWTIVVFTLALTMALLPIRVWTFHSMRKMQVVAPEMKAIQDRYKKYSMTDPRRGKMNEEIMEMYAKHGLSPWSQLGGCLPMLLQIPFLWAFYRMLAGAIELRHAPWIFWIHDLSVKDPYYILPIAMAVTTYLSTKMMPTAATVDPAQQRMMALMPLMLAFIFFRLSSGLNLYYFTSNIVSVAQQSYLNRTQPPPSRSKFKNKKNQR